MISHQPLGVNISTTTERRHDLEMVVLSVRICFSCLEFDTTGLTRDGGQEDAKSGSEALTSVKRSSLSDR